MGEVQATQPVGDELRVAVLQPQGPIWCVHSGSFVRSDTGHSRWEWDVTVTEVVGIRASSAERVERETHDARCTRCRTGYTIQQRVRSAANSALLVHHGSSGRSDRDASISTGCTAGRHISRVGPRVRITLQRSTIGVVRPRRSRISRTATHRAR